MEGTDAPTAWTLRVHAKGLLELEKLGRRPVCGRIPERDLGELIELLEGAEFQEATCLDDWPGHEEWMQVVQRGAARRFVAKDLPPAVLGVFEELDRLFLNEFNRRYCWPLIGSAPGPGTLDSYKSPRMTLSATDSAGQTRGNSVVSQPPESTRTSQPVANCVRLQAVALPDEPLFALAVEVENSCEDPIAILTAPLETRIRSTHEERLFWEDPSNERNAYARLYIFEKNAGLKSFIGHWGASIFGDPGWAVVAVGSKERIAVQMKSGFLEQLDPGDYGLLISTVAATSLPEQSSTANVFDQEQDIAAHNRQHEGESQVFLDTGVQPLGCQPLFFRVGQDRTLKILTETGGRD